MATLKHSNDQHGTTTLNVQQQHAYLGTQQQLSNYTKDLLNKRETTPGTVTCTNYPNLMKFQFGEENLQPQLYSNHIFPNSNIVFTPHQINILVQAETTTENYSQSRGGFWNPVPHDLPFSASKV